MGTPAGYAVALAVSETATNIVIRADGDRDADCEPGGVHVSEGAVFEKAD